MPYGQPQIWWPKDGDECYICKKVFKMKIHKKQWLRKYADSLPGALFQLEIAFLKLIKPVVAFLEELCFRICAFLNYRKDQQILKEIKMRAAQLASGDYKVCGLLAEEIGKEILTLLK